VHIFYGNNKKENKKENTDDKDLLIYNVHLSIVIMAKNSNNGTTWRLEGDYFEGCNCKSICPCLFKLDPTEGECKVVVAWHIEKRLLWWRY